MTNYRSHTTRDSLDASLDDYLAGRMSAADTARLEHMIAENPELRLRVETLREQEEALRHLGAEILDEPVPEQLLQALGLDDPDEE